MIFSDGMDTKQDRASNEVRRLRGGTDQELVDGFDRVSDRLNHEYTIGFRPITGFRS